jgi:hypothetical protein
MDNKQLREYVIRPTLKYIGMYSESAEELLVLTAAHESLGGKYLHQVGGGPAIGIFQMEPVTHDDCWLNWLHYQAEAAHKIGKLSAPKYTGIHPATGRIMPEAEQMAGNLYYATAMARVKYRRDKHALPDADDVDGLAGYWKRVYNTHLGAGLVSHAVTHYQRYVG